LTGLGDIAGGAVANNFDIVPGTYGLRFAGSTAGSASYAGTIDFAPVPEPATWATMIAGFGMVAAAMRRGKRKQAMIGFA